MRRTPGFNACMMTGKRKQRTTENMAPFRNVEAAPRDDGAPPTSDHDLMGLAGHGDQDAFAELCERYLKIMLGVAQRILGNAAEADEVAQEAFLRLWTYAPRWDPDGAGSVRTWLSRVVTNLCLDRMRRRRSVPLDEAGDFEDPALSATETIGQEDRRKIVQEMLDQLPERQKAAVVLAYFEEMSGKEIAEAMGLSVGAVESLLVRARKTLRDEVQARGLVWGESV